MERDVRGLAGVIQAELLADLADMGIEVHTTTALPPAPRTPPQASVSPAPKVEPKPAPAPAVTPNPPAPVRELERYYRPSEIAKSFRVRPNTVYRWLANGRLRGKLMLGLWRIPQSAIEELLNTPWKHATPMEKGVRFGKAK